MKVFYQRCLLLLCLAHYFQSSGLAKLLAMLTAAHGEQGSSGEGVVLCWLTALETESQSTALPHPLH